MEEHALLYLERMQTNTLLVPRRKVDEKGIFNFNRGYFCRCL